MEVLGQLATRFEVLLPHMNERQQRLALAVEARLLGRGGVRAVAQVAGVSETTVRKGVVELEAGEEPFPPGRVRRPGGDASRPPGRTLISSQPCSRWWSGRARRSDVAAAVDDQVAAAPGRGADQAGPSGLRPDGGPTVAAGRVQPADQRQDARRRPAPRPGCPVPLPVGCQNSSCYDAHLYSWTNPPRTSRRRN